MSVYLLVTLDTKGEEAALVRDALVGQGADVIVVDTGCVGEPSFPGDVTREEVFVAAGTTLQEMTTTADRGLAIKRASEGARKIVQAAFEQGTLDGLLALGGSAGTTIGTAAMQCLPLGVPKLMVSTLASGQVRQWVCDKDIMMLNSVVDIAGINRISRLVLNQAAVAMQGMAKQYASERSSEMPHDNRQHDNDPHDNNQHDNNPHDNNPRDNNPRDDNPHDDKPLVAATMFGVTTPCVQRARQVLEEHGFEVLIFHATGNGGQAMESLIHDGVIVGVLDITTTELADELVGGTLSAGPTRLTAAGECSIPQVISVGATDMVNFGPVGSIPTEFEGRLFYEHNPTVTLMRTTAQENQKLGREIARKANAAGGVTTVMLPLHGVSAIDATGQPFEDEHARQSLFQAIREDRASFELVEANLHINDEEFAELAAMKLVEMIRETM